MSVLVEFSMRPMDKGEGVGEYVARCIKVVEESGLRYETNAMGTTIEGDSWTDCFRVIEQCHDALAKDCKHVSTSIRVDVHEGPVGRIKERVESVEKHLGHEVAR